MAFSGFIAPPGEGKVTVLEENCQFLALPQDELEARYQVYCDVVVQDGGLPSEEGSSSAQSAFVPVHETKLKKAFNEWRYHGLDRALEILLDEAESSSSSPVKACLYCVRSLRKLQTPQPHLSSKDICAKFSATRLWSRSVIRCFAMHPRLQKVAIARQDNVVEIKDLISPTSNRPGRSVLLRDKQQVDVTCIQWAPHCSNLLAVGSRGGILLWTVDHPVTTSRLLSSWVRTETVPGHCVITSISWSPHGDLLISASPVDAHLVVWDVMLGVATRISVATGGGLVAVAWSPDGRRVLTTSTMSVFRVWETRNWTCDKWTNASSRCRAACWSPNGETMVFALERDPSLYYLLFKGEEITDGSAVAIKCADLSPCVHSVDGEDVHVGGCVHSLAWDPSGERMAIIFTDDSPGSELVAVFRTRLSPILELLPGGFVRGRHGELPVSIQFHTQGLEGTLLAVAWNSGRISFVLHRFTQCPVLPEVTSLSHQYNSNYTELFSI